MVRWRERDDKASKASTRGTIGVARRRRKTFVGGCGRARRRLRVIDGIMGMKGKGREMDGWTRSKSTGQDSTRVVWVDQTTCRPSRVTGQTARAHEVNMARRSRYTHIHTASIRHCGGWVAIACYIAHKANSTRTRYYYNTIINTSLTSFVRSRWGIDDV